VDESFLLGRGSKVRFVDGFCELNPEILNYFVSRNKVTHAKRSKAFGLDDRSFANFALGTLRTHYPRVGRIREHPYEHGVMAASSAG
jgi:hypothetical protein